MARLHGPFQFTGPLKGLIAYTRHDLPGRVILRTPPASRKEDYHTKPTQERNRRNGAEFGGRSTAAKWIRRALHPLRPLEDYHTGSALNSLLKAIQERDTVSEFGKRNVCITQKPRLLEGFNFNQKDPFDSVVRNPVSCSLDRDTLSARVEVPALLYKVNFFPPDRPLFRFTALLGVVPDLFYDRPLYQPMGDYHQLYAQVVHTGWQAVKSGLPAITLELQLPYTPPNDAFSPLLAVGVEMGTTGIGGRVETARRTGCAKIAAMA